MKSFLLSSVFLLASAAGFAQDIPNMVGRFSAHADQKPVAVPLTIEGGQPFFEMEQEGPSGNRKFLVLLNMGQGFSGWMQPVWEDVGFVKNSPARFRIGGVPIEAVPHSLFFLDKVDYPNRQLLNFFSTRKLEGLIGCGILEIFDVALDYSQKTMTLAAPGTLPHDGVAVPIHLRPETAVITVDVTVDGKSYPMAIDTGGAYTWIRPSTAAQWLKGHPDWVRGKGAVGAANWWMQDVPAEEKGTLIRVPELQIGSMKVANVGVLGTDQKLGGPFQTDSTEMLYDQWQKGATPGPVVAWLGGNVLKHYRVTIDYKAQMSWWQKTSDIDPHELDQIGINLVYDKGSYRIGAIVTQNGKPTVDDVQKGDKIVAIDEVEIEGWSRDRIYTALGGKPGDIHRVTVERAGKSLTVPLPVTAF